MELISRLLVPALNHMLTSAPWATQRLHQHAGTTACIDAGPLRLILHIDSHGLFRMTDGEPLPEVTIVLPDDFAVRMLVDRGSVFRAARLSGQADVAETLAFVFRNLSWDAEGDLAALIGDIPAYRLARLGRQAIRQAGDGGQRLLRNVSEFIADERGLAASRDEVQTFAAAVDALRHDLARLEKRIARLG